MMLIRSNALRAVLKTKIDTAGKAVKSAFTSYYLYSGNQAYPRAEFEVSRLSEIDGAAKYNLVINIFTKSQEDTESIADAIEEYFDGYKYADNDIAFYCYRNLRSNVIEEDKGIKRIRLLLDMTVYARKEA